MRPRLQPQSKLCAPPKKSVDGLIIGLSRLREIPLRAESLPAMIYATRVSQNKVEKGVEILRLLDSFIAGKNEASEVEAYWHEALKLDSFTCTITNFHPIELAEFESARCSERILAIYSELSQSQPSVIDHTDIAPTPFLNEKVFQPTMNMILPIIVGCLSPSAFAVALRRLLASSLAASHVGVIALNYPFLCKTITDIILSDIQNASANPAIIWRGTRVLMHIASLSKDLAQPIRAALATKKEQPRLCIEITARFLHDTDTFVNAELAGRKQISGFWLIDSCPFMRSFTSFGQGNNLVAATVRAGSSHPGIQDNSVSAAEAAVASKMSIVIATKICQLVSQRMREIISLIFEASKTSYVSSEGQPPSIDRQAWTELFNDFLRCASVLAVCSWAVPNIEESECTIRTILDILPSSYQSHIGDHIYDEATRSKGSNEHDEEALKYKLAEVALVERVLRVILALLLVRLTSLIAAAVASSSSSVTSPSTLKTVPRAPWSMLSPVVMSWTSSAKSWGSFETFCKSPELNAKVAVSMSLLDRVIALQDRIIGYGGTISSSKRYPSQDAPWLDRKEDKYMESSNRARSLRLFLRIIVAFDTPECRIALSDFCKDELRLRNIGDFMPCGSGCTVEAVAQSLQMGTRDLHDAGLDGGPMVGTIGSWILGVCGKLLERSIAPQERERMMNATWIIQEFRQIRRPRVISASSEFTGDWLCCLSLLFSCNILRSGIYEDITPPIDCKESPNQIASSGNKKVTAEVDGYSSRLIDADGSTHAVMHDVLLCAHWPPHSWIQRTLDCWTLRCAQGGAKLGTSGPNLVMGGQLRGSFVDGGADDSTDGAESGVGLTLLQEEAVRLSSVLAENNLVENFPLEDLGLCDGCGSTTGGGFFSFSVPTFKASWRYRRAISSYSNPPSSTVFNSNGGSSSSSLINIGYGNISTADNAGYDSSGLDSRAFPRCSQSSRSDLTTNSFGVLAKELLARIGVAVLKDNSHECRSFSTKGEICDFYNCSCLKTERETSSLNRSEDFLNNSFGIIPAKGLAENLKTSNTEDYQRLDNSKNILKTLEGDRPNQETEDVVRPADARPKGVRSNGKLEIINELWPGVLACYTALQFAALSPEEGLIYRGPFVSDLRALPVKTALQFLIRAKGHPVASTMLVSTIELVHHLCPELLLEERVDGFTNISADPTNNWEKQINESPGHGVESHISASSIDLNNKSIHLPRLREMFSTKKRIGTSFSTISTGCVLATNKLMSSLRLKDVYAVICGDIVPSVMSYPDVQTVRIRSDGSDCLLWADDSLISRCSIAWSIWKNMHARISTPQMLEITTVNAVLDHIINDDSQIWQSIRPCTMSSVSFNRLAQEPLLLFRFPVSLLSHPFVCRLVCFVTRSALVASRSAIHEALRCKQRVASNFLNASLKDRSTTEASLHIQEEMYIDLQELMAARVILQLWQQLVGLVKCDSKQDYSYVSRIAHDKIGTSQQSGKRVDNSRNNSGEDESCEDNEINMSGRRLLLCDLRSVLSGFMSLLLTENSSLIGLLLETGIEPEGMHLLMNCGQSVVDSVGQSLLAAVISEQPATPAIVENILRHALTFFYLQPHCEYARRLAQALPGYLIRATSSLNPHLAPKETRSAEHLCAATVSTLIELFPDCSLRLIEFVNKQPSASSASSSASTASLGRQTGLTHAAAAAAAAAAFIASKEDDKPCVKSLRTSIMSAFRSVVRKGSPNDSHMGKTHTSAKSESSASMISQSSVLMALLSRQLPKSQVERTDSPLMSSLDLLPSSVGTVMPLGSEEHVLGEGGVVEDGEISMESLDRLVKSGSKCDDEETSELYDGIVSRDSDNAVIEHDDDDIREEQMSSKIVDGHRKKRSRSDSQERGEGDVEVYLNKFSKSYHGDT